MRDSPLFSDLIVSRARPAGRFVARARGLAVALSLHTATAAALLLAPLVVLEVMIPIGARSSEPIQIFQPVFSIHPSGGDRLPVPRARKGGASPAQAISRRDLMQPEALPAPASDPIPTPDAGTIDTVAADRTAGTSPGPGDPDGEGEGDRGSPFGCDGCLGSGPEGPGDDHASVSIPFQPDDPRVTLPIIIPSSRALPRYPDLARRAGLQGTVILMIVIGSDGRVGEIEVLRSPDQRWGFDLAAIEAVKQWRYRPALMAGRPVAIYAQIMVEFAIGR